MKKYFKRVQNILTKNSALLEVLLFCSMILLIIMMFAATRVLANAKLLIGVFSLLALLTLAFMSGWLNVVKSGVDNYIETDITDISYLEKLSKYNITAFKSFFPGISEYFLPVLGYVIVWAVCLFLYFSLFGFVASKLFPEYINMVFDVIAKLSKVTTVVDVQNIIYANKSIVIFLLVSKLLMWVFQYFTLFCLPVLYFKTKNPFKAVLEAIKFNFKHFSKTTGLFLILVIISLFVNILSSFLTLPILSLIALFIMFIYLTYITTLIFVFYRNVSLQEVVDKMNTQDVFIKSSEVDNEQEQ